jgi:hypothetical protein
VPPSFHSFSCSSRRLPVEGPTAPSTRREGPTSSITIPTLEVLVRAQVRVQEVPAMRAIRGMPEGPRQVRCDAPLLCVVLCYAVCVCDMA